MSDPRTKTSKDHNYPPCIGDDGPMTSGDCARWLEAKYSRHHELEDQASAQMIRNQAQEIHRLRAIIEGNKAHGFETPACAVVMTAEALLEVLPVPNDYYGDEAQALRDALDANILKALEGRS